MRGVWEEDGARRIALGVVLWEGFLCVRVRQAARRCRPARLPSFGTGEESVSTDGMISALAVTACLVAIVACLLAHILAATAWEMLVGAFVRLGTCVQRG